MSAGVQVADQAVSGDESVAGLRDRRRSRDPRNLPVYSHSPGDEGRTPEIELPVANARLLGARSGVGPTFYADGREAIYASLVAPHRLGDVS